MIGSRRAGRVIGTSVALHGAVLLCIAAGACSHPWGDLEPSGASSTAGSGGDTGSSSSSGSGVTSSSGSGSGGGASSSSTGSGTGGGGPLHCGGTNILSWDFANDIPDVFDDDSHADLMNGEGVVTLPANADNYFGSAFTTVRVHDLRGDRVFVKVTQVPNMAAGAWATLELDYYNGDDLFMSAYEGKLECGFDRGGNESLPAQEPYDPVQHLYWQLREDKGRIYCETSPDAKNWHEVGSYDIAQSLLAPPAAVRVELIGVTPDHVAMPGEAHFDDLNGAQPPTGYWCKASSLSDNFAATQDIPGAAWDRGYADQGTSVDQTGGTVNFHYGSNEWNGAGYESSAAFDITNERVTIQVVQAQPQSKGYAYFAVGNNDDREIYWTINSDGFECGYDGPSGSQTIWQGQAPALPAFIGVREAGGKLHCEILEGAEWKSYGSIGGVVDTTRVAIAFGAYLPGGHEQGNHVVSFDNYNLAP